MSLVGLRGSHRPGRALDPRLAPSGPSLGRRRGSFCLCVSPVSLRFLEEAQAAPLGTGNFWNCWERHPAHRSDTGLCALTSTHTNKCLLEAPEVFSLLGPCQELPQL